MDNKRKVIEGLRELSLFAGAGGGVLAGKLLGWRTVCAVENDPYAASVLIQRQNDGILQPFPIWDDVQTFDGKPWKGIVDVVSGGFPCQDISAAGKGAGIEGKRSGLWKEMSRIIGEIRPPYAFVENSPILTCRGLGIVLGDLAEMGYDAKWGVLGGRSVENCGLIRERIWIVAWDSSINVDRVQIQKKECVKCKLYWHKKPLSISNVETSWLMANGYAVRKIDDVAGTMDRVKAIGNGQIPAVAKRAWEILI